MLKRFILHHSDSCTISDVLCGWVVSRWMWLSDAMSLSQCRSNRISCQHINEQFLPLFLLALCYHRSRSLIRITLKWWQTSITLRKKIVVCTSRCDCWVIALWSFPASTDGPPNTMWAILSSLLSLAEISFIQRVRWSITTRARLTCSTECEDVVVALNVLLLSEWGLKTLILIEIVLTRISCLGNILLRSWNSNHLPARNWGIRQSWFGINILMLLIFTNRERLSRKFSSCKGIHTSFMRWYSSLSCCQFL